LELSVLLRGETGTGKELAAHAIHTASGRADRRMLAVNLGALEASVIASELFGHVRGAFTGASDARRGYFRDCDGGTLFLDEVGEAPAEVQRSLLRVLETGEVVPVGADRPIKTDVRVIAATDADLEADIAERDFRAPLFHRLAEYEVRLPPLRAHQLDIPLLFRHFLIGSAKSAGMSDRLNGTRAWIPTKLIRELLQHEWPGNARELRNVVSTALLNTPVDSDLSLGDRFERSLSLAGVRLEASGSRGIAVQVPLSRRDLSTVSDDELIAALEQHDWRPEPAAATLGIAKTSIYQLIRQNGTIPRSASLDEDVVVAALERASSDVAKAAKALRVPKRGLLHRMKKLGIS
jgi:two-component system nitrogen regulation response regulator GlnG